MHLYDQVRKDKSKGYVELITNHGKFSLQLHCDIAPKTCDNFLLLSSNGYFNGTSFHRLVGDFMIQGGDPTGTGRGGQSVFGKPFEDEIDGRLKHDGPGVVSMANTGVRNDNKSQFFMTFSKCSHLDGKHTVFGKIVVGINDFMKLNFAATDGSDRPINPIKIEKILIVSDPFRELELSEQDHSEQAKIDAENALYIRAARGDVMANHPNRSLMRIGKYIDWDNIPLAEEGKRKNRSKPWSMASWM